MLDTPTADACAPMGTLEYVIEHRHGASLETWLVLQPHPELAPTYHAMGLSISPGCRVVVDAISLRPIAVLDDDECDRVQSGMRRAQADHAA